MQQATDNIWEWLKGDNAKVIKVIKKSVWIKRLKTIDQPRGDQSNKVELITRHRL